MLIYRFVFLLAALVGLDAVPVCAASAARAGEVVSLPGDQFAAFAGCPIARLALLACTPSCQPIPFQVDERDADGRWVIEHGPLSTLDDPPGVLDGNDLLLFMTADAGVRAHAADLPLASHAQEILLHDPVTGATQWAYLVAFPDDAPRSPATSVHYDAATDRVSGDRVTLGFVAGMPGYLAIGDGPNVLDRLKVRASATFLFGLIHFTRSEEDLRTQFMGWHEGPIRVIRAQRQWVRLGWGIRSPTFGSYTYFYRDSAQLPVGLRLNFPPTYFFGNIVIRVVLDFRDLRGWSVLVPSRPESLPIDGTMSTQKIGLAHLSDTWFALRGPQITLVQTMDVSPSLATVRRRMLYHEGLQSSDPPEAVAGEMPGIGWQFDEWEHVGAGAHQLSATSYALPADVDVREFMRLRATPLEVTVHPLP